MSDANGTLPDVNMNRVAEALQEDSTAGYVPQMPLEAMWAGGGEMPQITLRRDLWLMMLHPIVSIALEYYKSGIAGAEFWGGPDHNNPDNEMGKPISPDQRVSEFVLAHCERFWQRGMPLLQEGGYPHGWAAGEHMYKEVSGMMVWSHLKDFMPTDAFILTEGDGHVPVGTLVKNVRNKPPVELWFASGAIPAKACWYSHRPRFNQFYGRSQLSDAWLPWRMLGWRDGVDQIINAAIYRAGYAGPMVGHPKEDMQTAKQGVPATQTDGQGNPRRSARDVARQMIEWGKAGAGYTYSTEVYPGTSIPKWVIKWPEHVMDVRPLVDAARWLEERIMLGIGVPPELVKAGGTGSGYSGRSIPREAFLDGQQRVANAMLQKVFIEPVVKPLVLMNFGDVPFEVSCKSLLASQADDKQPNQPQPGQQPPNPAQPAPAPPPVQQPAPAMSLGTAADARVLDIVRRIMARRAA